MWNVNFALVEVTCTPLLIVFGRSNCSSKAHTKKVLTWTASILFVKQIPQGRLQRWKQNCTFDRCWDSAHCKRIDYLIFFFCAQKNRLNVFCVALKPANSKERNVKFIQFIFMQEKFSFCAHSLALAFPTFFTKWNWEHVRLVECCQCKEDTCLSTVFFSLPESFFFLLLLLLQDVELFDLEDFKYNNVNITAFRLVDIENPNVADVVEQMRKFQQSGQSGADGGNSKILQVNWFVPAQSLFYFFLHFDGRINNLFRAKFWGSFDKSAV